MNITLTQQDADWVASKIRDQIADLEEAYKEAMNNGTKRSEFCYSMCKTLFGKDGDAELEKDINKLRNEEEKAITRLNEIYKTKKAAYQKIIELMVCGSEM